MAESEVGRAGSEAGFPCEEPDRQPDSAM